MSNSSEAWKVVAVTGTLTIAISSSALAAIDPSFISDHYARLQHVRSLAEQGHFVVRNRDNKVIVAGDEFNKIDGGK
jgi:hypothetical protein